MKTIYTIPAPDSLGAMIEVYGEPENAWYEWRIIDGGRTVRDTGTEGHSAFQGRQYGQAERLWLGAAGCSRTLPRRFCLRLGGIARFQTGGIGRRVAVDGQARSEHERIT